MASRPPMKGFFKKLKRQVRGKPIVVAAQREEGGGGGDSRPKGIPLFQVYKRVGVSGLVEICYRVGKSVISVAKGTKCLQMQFMVVKKIVTTF